MILPNEHKYSSAQQFHLHKYALSDQISIDFDDYAVGVVFSEIVEGKGLLPRNRVDCSIYLKSFFTKNISPTLPEDRNIQ